MQQTSAQVIALNFGHRADLTEKADLPTLRQRQDLRLVNVNAVQTSQPAGLNRLKSCLILGFVLLAHVCAIYFLTKLNHVIPPKIEPAKPMLVSLIAPPAPEPELVPVIEPPKQVVKPKPVLKKVVKEIRPLDRPVENPTETVVEQTQIEPAPEAPAPQPELIQPKAPPAKPVVEEKIEPPKFGVSYLNNPEPEYPRISRRAGEEGRVLLRVLVSQSGAAEEVTLEQSSGYTRLDDAALEAVKKWRFIPARKNNQNLSAQVLVPIKFSISN